MTGEKRPRRERPVQLIEKFEGLNVLVIGEAMLDSYLHGSTDRLCREAPVPVVTLARRVNAPGGAGNTAVNVRTLGAQVHFLSVIGRDPEGEMLREALTERDVSTEHLVVHPTRRTVAKHRVLAQSHMLVRYDQGSTEPLDEQAEAQVVHSLNDLLPRMDAVIVSDYGYGILTRNVVRGLAEFQKRSPLVLVVDSKNLPFYRNVGVTAVKPNYREAMQLLGLRHLPESNRERAELLIEYGDRVIEITGARIAAVTLDSEGALIFERGGQPYRTYARPTTDSQAAGAGDTFVSALTLAIASGADTAAAGELASAAAAIAVSKDGTSSCSAAELIEHMGSRGKYYVERERLGARLELHREQGQRVVFTNGCFDILH
ncbi:MAG: PfkB family carbohydrate kinase, partial [Rudaea sp.]